ncbi:MAG: FecR family protein, partial [Holophagales bacterium]|nr:FecR family protein [Holophagales bacterium]
MLSSIGQISSLRLASFIAPAALICPSPCFAQTPDEYLGERPERYAMVRYVEGSVKIRKWDVDEELTIGTPIGEGDVIESSGRGVIQLGDGTKIAFGEKIRLEVATLFDDQDDGTQALFRLHYGRLRIVVGPRSDAYIRIDTPSGIITLRDRSDASLDVGVNNSVRVKVFSGSVVFRNKIDETNIRAGEWLTIYSNNERLDRTYPFNTYEIDVFEAWAEKHIAYKLSVNSKYVPSEIRHYADTLDGHGDWVNVVEVGWCWRPRITIPSWRPYWRGYWGAYRGGMTWISYDPFGYMTHHYGRWGWSSHYGWYWIPGVYYSPAWVVWNMSGSYFGWAPMGYYNRPVYWGQSNWHHDLWNVVDIRYIRNRQIYNHTVWDRNLSGHFPSYNASRSLTPAWKQGPLLVTRQEFSNPDPAQFRRILSNEVSAERFKAYEQQ